MRNSVDKAIAWNALAEARADEREKCAKIAEAGAKQCADGDSEWHRGFRYAAQNTALGIADTIRAANSAEK